MTSLSYRTMTIALAVAMLSALAPPSAAAAGAVVADGVTAALATGDGAPVTVWVRFRDKGESVAERTEALAAAAAGLDARTRKRRARGSLGSLGVDAGDLPLCNEYLAAATATGAVPRHRSRWLNAASYEASAGQVTAIAALPCVVEVDLVARGRGTKPVIDPDAALAASSKSLGELDYGASYHVLALHDIPVLHGRGLTGRGVTVALLDTGFDLDHESLRGLDVVATRNFIQGGTYVDRLPGEHPAQSLYGTAALSVLAGYSRDDLVGAAYGASVVLAKTEDLADETPAEEDAWIAALEWAESLGVDVVSSGLGYYEWYGFDELDGRTAAITVAAEMAAARGVCVVNAVGDLRTSADWPHILPPSDGRNVIGVGTVDANSQVAWFSSPGPTADGRTKPDVMAFGAGLPVAVAGRDDLYNRGTGSSYATALVAGTVALMLEQDSALGPVQVLEALRATASRASLPDNDYGWGVFDGAAALDYWVPSIMHEPLADEEGGTGVHRVSALISDRSGLDPDRLTVTWRADGGPWGLVPLQPDGGESYTASIPPQGRTGTLVEYYLTAANVAGRFATEPADAPAGVYAFRVGPDTTPPVLDHIGLPDMRKAEWPPVLRVEASDNKGLASVEVLCGVPGLGNVGPFPLVDMGDHYALEFPVDAASVFPGFTINYLFVARDTADSPNLTSAGPYAFRIVPSRGRVLVVDDRNNTKTGAASGRPGAAGAGPAIKAAGDLVAWLNDAGFTANSIDAGAARLSDFVDYDAVMVTCGGNFGPFVHPELRRAMVAWVADGGRMVVEGGETAYAAAVAPGYPDLVGSVLPIVGYGGEEGGTLQAPAGLSRHPLVNRPHRLASPFIIDNSNGQDYGASDLVLANPDAFVPLRALYGGDWGGVMAYDDNTCPDAGQIVYLPFDLAKATAADGRALLDNVMTWLMGTEPPGSAVVSGRVTLAGRTDHGGVTVRVGRSQTAVTATDGSFQVTGLWGGEYTVAVAADGFAPGERRIVVTDGIDRGPTDFLLVPVTEATYATAPAAPIPDNDPVGIQSALTVVESGVVFGLTVDIDVSHFSVGQLVVTLTNPAGVEVTLHNRTGGTADDLVGNWTGSFLVDGPGEIADLFGTAAAGTWTLGVADRQLGALGTFNSWGLNLLARTDDVAAAGEALVVGPRLVGNTPNPFNPRTTVVFEVTRSGHVSLAVYDVRGRRVRNLADGVFPAGRHGVVWDGRNDAGGDVASGLYFARFVGARTDGTHKMLLVR